MNRGRGSMASQNVLIFPDPHDSLVAARPKWLSDSRPPQPRVEGPPLALWRGAGREAYCHMTRRSWQDVNNALPHTQHSSPAMLPVRTRIAPPRTLSLSYPLLHSRISWIGAFPRFCLSAGRPLGLSAARPHCLSFTGLSNHRWRPST